MRKRDFLKFCAMIKIILEETIMKKVTIFLGLTIVLSSCQYVTPPTSQAPAIVRPTLTANTITPPKQENSYEYDPAHPVTTVDEAVNIIISRLGQDDITYLKHSTEADRYMLHFGLGMGIRNSFGLWKGNEALLKIKRCLRWENLSPR